MILSADGELKVYLVPDFVAQSLGELCMDFSMNRDKLQIHFHDEKGYVFNETDFIEYLNEKSAGMKSAFWLTTSDGITTVRNGLKNTGNALGSIFENIPLQQIHLC